MYDTTANSFYNAHFNSNISSAGIILRCLDYATLILGPQTTCHWSCDSTPTLPIPNAENIRYVSVADKHLSLL